MKSATYPLEFKVSQEGGLPCFQIVGYGEPQGTPYLMNTYVLFSKDAVFMVKVSAYSSINGTSNDWHLSTPPENAAAIMDELEVLKDGFMDRIETFQKAAKGLQEEKRTPQRQTSNRPQNKPVTIHDSSPLIANHSDFNIPMACWS